MTTVVRCRDGHMRGASELFEEQPPPFARVDREAVARNAAGAPAGLQTGGAQFRQAPIRVALVVRDAEVVDPGARAVPVHLGGVGVEIRCDRAVTASANVLRA